MSSDDISEDWELEVDLGALDSKINTHKTARDEEEDELQIATPEVATPSAATIAAREKQLAVKELTLQNQVQNALREGESADDKKLREMRQVEDADHALTEELMGAKISTKDATSDRPTGLAAIALNTKADHTKFGVTISKKIADSTPLGVTAFLKALCERLPPGVTTEAFDSILNVLKAKREERRKSDGEAAKVVKSAKSSKDIKKEKKRHTDVFGGDFVQDEYYEAYGNMEEEFM
jgi:hypothetical protein